MEEEKMEEWSHWVGVVGGWVGGWVVERSW